MSYHRSTIITFIIGVGCFLIPALIYALWINAFSRFDQPEDRHDYFMSFFPGFLQGRFDITYLSLILLAAAIFLFARVGSKSRGLLKSSALAMVIVSSLLFLLNAWSLL